MSILLDGHISSKYYYKTEICNTEISYIEVLYIIGKHLFDYKLVYSFDHMVPEITYVHTTNNIN